MNPKVINHDIYNYRQLPDGTWEITKNGGHYMMCSGGEQSAKHIVFLLNTDVFVTTIKEHVNGKK